MVIQARLFKKQVYWKDVFYSFLLEKYQATEVWEQKCILDYNKKFAYLLQVCG